MSAAPFEPGIGADGQLPLPWLAAPLAAARALGGAHALLAHGPAGVGQLEFGVVLAQGWLCESGQPQACGRCASCHLVRSRTHPDLMVLVPDAMRLAFGWVADEDPLFKQEAKPSKELRIAQVRAAIDWSQRTSGRGRGKALVMHPADAMNGPTANALLKTLEEPPGDLRLVLTSSDPELLLPTVRSRCQRLRLPMPGAAEALAWLKAQGVADAAPLLAVAGGSPLEARAMAAEGIDGALLQQLARAVAAGDAAPLIGKPVPRVLELLAKLAHDALVQAAGGTPRYLPPASVPAGASVPGLHGWHASLRRAARHDDHPWNAGLLIEALVTEGASAWRGAGRSRPQAPGASLNSAR